MNIKIFLILLILFIYLSGSIYAADLIVDCPDAPTVCSKTGSDPLFATAVDGYWFPGRSLTKTVILKNSSSQTKSIAIKATRTTPPNVLDKIMQLSITGLGRIIWSGNLNDFYSQEKIKMGDFRPQTSGNYNFSVGMPANLGNEYKNMATVFDLDLGFWEENILGERAPAVPMNFWQRFLAWLWRLLALLKNKLNIP